MFNKELKERFLNDVFTNDNIKKNYIVLFNYTEPYESREGMDLNALPVSVLQEIVDSLRGASVPTRSNKVTAMKNYCEWCLKNGFVSELTWKRVNINYSNSTTLSKDIMVKSPMHLQKCMDNVFNSESDNTSHLIFRCYLWLAYSGVRESSINAITKDNIDLNNRKIIIDDMNFVIYEQSVNSFRKCMELTEFNYIHPNYGIATKERSRGALLLRGTGENENINLQVIRSELARKTKRAIKNGAKSAMLSYGKAILYGVCYRTWQGEIANGVPDIDAGVRELIYAKNLRNDYKAIKRIFKRDYDFWKQSLI